MQQRLRNEIAGLINKKKYSPVTANGWFRVLRVITKAAVAEFELPRDPAAGIKNFDTSLTPTYTEEEPNSLLVEETPYVDAAALRPWVGADGERLSDTLPLFTMMTCGLIPAQTLPLRYARPLLRRTRRITRPSAIARPRDSYGLTLRAPRWRAAASHHLVSGPSFLRPM
jgi:hypothetical protein